MKTTSPLFFEILAYLLEHPDAQDTLEGIMQWWLLEQHLQRGTKKVKAALEQLVAEEFVVANKGGSGRIYYRVNRQKLREIRRLLAEHDGQ